MKTIKDLCGNEYTFNNKRKIDRFLKTLGEKVCFTNGHLRVIVEKGYYINVYDKRIDIIYSNGQTMIEFNNYDEEIEKIKEMLTKQQ